MGTYVPRMPLSIFRTQGPRTSLGSYPVHAIMADGEPLCHACISDESNPVHDGCPTGKCLESDRQWCYMDADVYWEGPTLHCANCNAELESAYGDPDVSRIEWAAGARLRISGHASSPGAGLSYTARIVTALEDGASGGWDVYDGLTEDGKEIAFYGFSVEAIITESD